MSKYPTPPSRQGKVSLPIWVTPEAREALKLRAIAENTSVQRILECAVAREAKKTMKPREAA
jgi:hypothetical protein